MIFCFVWLDLAVHNNNSYMIRVTVHEIVMYTLDHKILCVMTFVDMFKNIEFLENFTVEILTISHFIFGTQGRLGASGPCARANLNDYIDDFQHCLSVTSIIYRV